MRQFLLGLLTAVLSLSFLLGGAFLLAKTEKKGKLVLQKTAQTETVPETTTISEETLPLATTISKSLQTVPKTVDMVPKYYQTDYPYIKFGNGTIATSGCSMTCLAMVATYLTNQEYTPVQMAYHFGDYGKTNIERLDYGIDQMQIPYRRVEDVQEVLTSLRQGKIAIVMMDEESVFTTQQHFIVAAGMTDEGRFVINDPYETTYLEADVHLKNAYENGFEDYHLIRGFSGAWIFDKASMPQEPFLFDAAMPEQQTNRYEGYALTNEDIYTLACFAWAEAREEKPEVQQAVIEVVLNRLVSENYPNTVQGILKQTELYRAVKVMSQVDEPEQAQYLAVDAAMYGPYILPEDICFYSEWEKGQEIWGQLGKFTFAKKR